MPSAVEMLVGEKSKLPSFLRSTENSRTPNALFIPAKSVAAASSASSVATGLAAGAGNAGGGAALADAVAVAVAVAGGAASVVLVRAGGDGAVPHAATPKKPSTTPSVT